MHKPQRFSTPDRDEQAFEAFLSELSGEGPGRTPDPGFFDRFVPLPGPATPEIARNRYFGGWLNWTAYTPQIEQLLGIPPNSGEAALVEAVKSWQKKKHYKKPDGIIGPKLWKTFQKALNITVAPNYTVMPQSDIDVPAGNGWNIAGGGKLQPVLCRLWREGKISITPFDIAVLLLMTDNETDQYINAINSYDSAFMTFGFTQATVAGRLQQIIRLAPQQFAKYGIELAGAKQYYPGKGYAERIKGTTTKDELRSRAWAERFYKAGLDEGIIIAQVADALAQLPALRRSCDRKDYLDRFNGRYPNLWAYIYESNNSRPAYLVPALKSAVSEADEKHIDDPVAFADLLRRHIAAVIRKASKGKDELSKADSIYGKMHAGTVTAVPGTYCN